MKSNGMDGKAELIAAIDVGTNSFHMVIGSVNRRGMLQILSRDKEMVRLGSGAGDMKHITAEAMERGIMTLKAFAHIAESSKAKIRAVATSAVREAHNQKEFLDRVKEEAGIDVEVVSGSEEGRLIYVGAMHALPIYQKKALLIDIGGGSTETIIGYKGEMHYVNSVKLGAIRLTRRFFPRGGNATVDQIAECREFIKGEWYPILRRIEEHGFETVIGTAGTILNIVIMAHALKGETIPDVINGLSADKAEILDVINRIVTARTVRTRQAIPGMDFARADIILAGALIFEHIVNQLNIEKICISTYALREGIVFDTVRKNQAIREYHNLTYLRYDTINSLCHQYNVDMKHAEYVKNMALKLYDDLQDLHGLDYTARELLEAGALLHDVGYHISHDQHHKHSYYIIQNCIMPGFTNAEAEVIANIARYHRKSHPKKKHVNFARLSPEKQRIVKILAGILRIAEGIDRRQQQIIKSVEADYNETEINIHIYCGNNVTEPDIELWGAMRRKLLLEETFGIKFNIYLYDKTNQEISKQFIPALPDEKTE